MNAKELIKLAEEKSLGVCSNTGAFIVETGKHTGRSANLRYIARHADIEDAIDWRSENKALPYPVTEKVFSALGDWLGGQKTFQFNGYAGAFPVQVTSSSPWHVAFANNMFREQPIDALQTIVKEPLTTKVLHAPYLKVSDLVSEELPETLIILDPKAMRVAIIGTAYAGEIKKSVFSLCNYALPDYGVLPMHASANCMEDGSQSCVLFGLSGTGKTTLSAASDRYLIGDDEIVWTNTGLSNLEGGCYAKLIDLKAEKEPEIFKAVNQPGAILENVVYDPDSKEVDFCDGSKTENTRGSYSIDALSQTYNQAVEAMPPKSIVFLVADAFGAMPAVAKLDEWQAQYHFLSGYTAKVAGTEMGVKTPSPVFSACFGSPFMPRHPSVYAKMLAKKAASTGTSIWLLNTGWTHGGYGKAERYPLQVTRAILSAIQTGKLDSVPTKTHPVFGFEVPTECPEVEEKWLACPEGPQVSDLATRFQQNFEHLSTHASKEVAEKGGPHLSH